MEFEIQLDHINTTDKFIFDHILIHNCRAEEFRMELPGFFFGYSGAFGEFSYMLVI